MLDIIIDWAVDLKSGGKRSLISEYARGLLADSKTPRSTLIDANTKNESVLPETTVVMLQTMLKTPRRSFLLRESTSASFPVKSPKNEKGIKNASPLRTPNSDSISGKLSFI